LPYFVVKECPQDGKCSGKGICNTTSGSCECTTGYFGDICSSNYLIQIQNDEKIVLAYPLKTPIFDNYFNLHFQKFIALEMDLATKMVIVILKLACVSVMKILMAVLVNVSHNLLLYKVTTANLWV